MDEGQLKNVCLSVCRLSVCCLSVCLWRVCPQISFELLVWLGQIFFYKNKRKCVFENFNPEVQGSRP